MGSHCGECGSEVPSGARYCLDCGALAGADGSAGMARSPLWPLLGLVGCYVAWFAALAAREVWFPLGVGALVAVLLSLLLLYVDARNATEAGELEIDYPIAVPIAVVLLWVFTLPAYVIYRFTKR